MNGRVMRSGAQSSCGTPLSSGTPSKHVRVHQLLSRACTCTWTVHHARKPRLTGLSNCAHLCTHAVAPEYLQNFTNWVGLDSYCVERVACARKHARSERLRASQSLFGTSALYFCYPSQACSALGCAGSN